MRFRVGILWWLLLGSAPLAAQTMVLVHRNVNLRRDPSTSQPPYRLLLPPEEVELLDTAKTNNYYHVYREESDEAGWVWASNVRLVEPTDLGGLLPTAPASAIDPAWPKPAPVSGNWRSPVRDSVCPAVGDGGDTTTNRRKNRTDLPTSYRLVTFDAIGDLEYPATRSTMRTAWPAETLAVVARYEGVAVTVVGWLVAIRPQTGGSGESTNCHMKRAAEVDWHMALVEGPGEGETEAVVIEPTPRIRVDHPKWTPARLNPWLDSHDPVRVSGWLMFDPSHRNHLGRYRKTLWEIHPVTRIEVWQGDAWVDVDDLPFD
jgi:hypothetical protein